MPIESRPGALSPADFATARGWLRGFVLHVLTGVLAVAAHYAVMALLLAAAQQPVAASATGFVAGAAVRYLLSHFHVFSPADGMPVTLARFAAALAMQFVANIVILDGLLRAGAPVWIAQASTTILMTTVNYLVYRLWVFR